MLRDVRSGRLLLTTAARGRAPQTASDASSFPWLAPSRRTRRRRRQARPGLSCVGAELPKNIFLRSGTCGDSYPLGTAALLLWVSFGLQSILCCSAPRRRKRGAPYSRNTPRKGEYSSRALPNTSPTTPKQEKRNAPCP